MLVCVQSQMGHALAQGQRNQGQPEFTSSGRILCLCSIPDGTGRILCLCSIPDGTAEFYVCVQSQMGHRQTTSSSVNIDNSVILQKSLSMSNAGACKRSIPTQFNSTHQSLQKPVINYNAECNTSISEKNIYQ